MYKDILLAVDLAHLDTQRKAVKTAGEYAKAFGSRLHLLTVVPDFGMSIVANYFPADFEHKALEQAREDLHAWSAENLPEELEVQHMVGHGTAYREILNYREKAKCDLIIMASHQPDLEDYLLGSNASKVVSHADCSVLVVR